MVDEDDDHCDYDCDDYDDENAADANDSDADSWFLTMMVAGCGCCSRWWCFTRTVLDRTGFVWWLLMFGVFILLCKFPAFTCLNWVQLSMKSQPAGASRICFGDWTHPGADLLEVKTSMKTKCDCESLRIQSNRTKKTNLRSNKI